MGEILDECPIKASMPQKTSNSIDIHRGWQLFNHLDLCPIHFYPFFLHSMSEDNPFSDHEVALLPIKD
jgi:hypothetical protein